MTTSEKMPAFAEGMLDCPRCGHPLWMHGLSRKPVAIETQVKNFKPCDAEREPGSHRQCGCTWPR